MLYTNTKKYILINFSILLTLFLVPLSMHAQEVPNATTQDSGVLQNVFSSISGALGIKKRDAEPNIAIVFKQPVLPIVSTEEAPADLDRNIPKPALEDTASGQTASGSAVMLGFERPQTKTHYTVFPPIPMLPGYHPMTSSPSSAKNSSITLTKELEDTVLEWNVY